MQLRDDETKIAVCSTVLGSIILNRKARMHKLHRDKRQKKTLILSSYYP